MDNKNIVDLAKEAQREYARAWRAKNPDKVRRHNQTYWEKQALKKMEGGTVCESTPNPTHEDY